MRDNPPVSHKRLLPVLKTKDGKPSRKKWAASTARRALKRWAKKGRTVDFAKYARAFLYVKPGKENDLTGYKLPIATIVAGKLTAIPHGIYAAAGVMEGARSRVKGMSKKDASAIMRTLERYYKKMGEVAPWPPYGPGTPAWSYGSRGKSKGPQRELALGNPRERITDAHLEGLLRLINVMTGNNPEARTQDESGRWRSNVGTYVIDSAYGGVALSQLDTEGGGERDIIRRGTKRELYERMRGFVAGLEAAGISASGRRNPHGPPHARGNFTEQQHRDLAENWGQTEREWMRTGRPRDAAKAAATAYAHQRSTAIYPTSFDEALKSSRGNPAGDEAEYRKRANLRRGRRGHWSPDSTAPRPEVGELYAFGDTSGTTGLVEEVYDDTRTAWVRAPQGGRGGALTWGEIARLERVDPGPRRNPHGPPHARGNFTEQEHRDLAENWGVAARVAGRRRRRAEEEGDERAERYAGARATFFEGKRHAHLGSHGPPGSYDTAQRDARRAADENPPPKWKRSAPGAYYLADIAEVRAYHPRKDAYARAMAADYEEQHGRKVPKGTKWLARDYRLRITAHRDLKSAKAKAGDPR